MAILVISPSMFGQSRTKGRIEGIVLDKQTRAPLPAVNIIIKGTYMGAATDMNGQYFIKNISPGQYDLEVSIIGYKIQLKTGVKVVAGQTQTINFELEE